MKDLRERCEKMLADMEDDCALAIMSDDSNAVRMLESFAREIRNEALEEAAKCVETECMNLHIHMTAQRLRARKTTALAAANTEE